MEGTSYSFLSYLNPGKYKVILLKDPPGIYFLDIFVPLYFTGVYVPKFKTIRTQVSGLIIMCIKG